MEARGYFPSGQFSALVAALLIAAGLIYAAGRAHVPQRGTLAAAADAAADFSGATPDWQAQFAGDTAPQDAAVLNAQANSLASAVQGQNLTNSIGKTLLVNLGAAQQQGLGGDTQSQSEIISQALALAGEQSSSTAQYSQSDLTVVADTQGTYRAYGNALAALISSHGLASDTNVLLAVSMAVDSSSASPLARLDAIAADYQALAADVIKLPVPGLLSSVNLSLANDYLQMGAAATQMESTVSDPLRGLMALQTYTGGSASAAQLFVQINTTMKNDGIVFSASEPGAAWSAFAASVAQAAQEEAATSAQSGSDSADISDSSDSSASLGSSIMNLFSQ